MRRSLIALVTVAIGAATAACEGPEGPAGQTGPVGTAGAPGATGSTGPQGATGPGVDASVPVDPLALDPKGLIGKVVDGNQRPVTSGTVFLVPKPDVETASAAPIDLAQSPAQAAASAVDEPLEDLLDTKGASYAQAKVDASGIYRLPNVASGTYFVVWRPDATDDAHLPGGDKCRLARASAALVGARLDIRVSGRPKDSAQYIGSATCLGCHGKVSVTGSAHRNALHAPGRPGYLQGLRRWPNFDAPLAAFDANTTLYFSACSTSATPACTVTTTPPAGVVSFEVRLHHTASGYSVDLVNRRGAGSTSYVVDLTYGGILSRRQFLTRVGVSHAPLPFEYLVADGTWRDAGSKLWYDIAAGTLRTFPNDEAFDRQCAGCHIPGMKLTGSSAAGWTALANPSIAGDADYDGDGRLEELNVGCESCHGPGSDHLSDRGARIVSPAAITPERETMMCGRCHSRPRGVGGASADPPLSAQGEMPPAWARRADVMKSYVTRVDADPAVHLYASGDSKAHHQQYTDFIRSSMYRNGQQLMTCSSCHDAHGNTDAHELVPPGRDNAACTTCHSDTKYTQLAPHIATVTKYDHKTVQLALFACVDCHMVKTAFSGAASKQLVPFTGPAPYLHGDIASHRFKVPLRNVVPAQPAAPTLKCGACHNDFLPGPG